MIVDELFVSASNLTTHMNPSSDR